MNASLHFATRFRKRLSATAALIVALAASAGALGYWTTSGSGSASASVGGLDAPAGVHATANGADATITWNAVTPPNGAVDGYVVTRSGSSGGTVCGTPVPVTALTCSDTGLGSGDYTYTVKAVWRSLTASAASTAVATLDHFTVAPASGTQAVGSPFTVAVTAVDHDGHVMTGYTGVVHFSSNDGLATLPSNYQFTGSDNGVRPFTNAITFKTAGASQSLMVNDTAVPAFVGTASYNVGKGSQTISFTSTAPATATVGGSTYTATATAGSGLTVAFTSATTAVCTSGGTNGATITFLTAGSCTINANQAGNTNWNPAPQLQQTFTVHTGVTITAVALKNGGSFSGIVEFRDTIQINFSGALAAATICSSWSSGSNQTASGVVTVTAGSGSAPDTITFATASGCTLHLGSVQVASTTVTSTTTYGATGTPSTYAINGNDDQIDITLGSGANGTGSSAGHATYATDPAITTSSGGSITNSPFTDSQSSSF